MGCIHSKQFVEVHKKDQEGGTSTGARVPSSSHHPSNRGIQSLAGSGNSLTPTSTHAQGPHVHPLINLHPWPTHGQGSATPSYLTPMLMAASHRNHSHGHDHLFSQLLIPPMQAGPAGQTYSMSGQPLCPAPLLASQSRGLLPALSPQAVLKLAQEVVMTHFAHLTNAGALSQQQQEQEAGEADACTSDVDLCVGDGRCKLPPVCMLDCPSPLASTPATTAFCPPQKVGCKSDLTTLSYSSCDMAGTEPEPLPGGARVLPCDVVCCDVGPQPTSAKKVGRRWRLGLAGGAARNRALGECETGTPYVPRCPSTPSTPRAATAAAASYSSDTATAASDTGATGADTAAAAPAAGSGWEAADLALTIASLGLSESAGVSGGHSYPHARPAGCTCSLSDTPFTCDNANRGDIDSGADLQAGICRIRPRVAARLARRHGFTAYGTAPDCDTLSQPGASLYFCAAYCVVYRSLAGDAGGEQDMILKYNSVGGLQSLQSDQDLETDKGSGAAGVGGGDKGHHHPDGDGGCARCAAARWRRYCRAALQLGRLLHVAPSRPSAAGASPAVTMHVVGPGETLQRIADVVGVHVDDLAGANPDMEAHMDLQPNDVIALPTPCVKPRLHAVQPGDTLVRVAQRYAVPIDRLVQYNSDLVACMPAMESYLQDVTAALRHDPNHRRSHIHPAVLRVCGSWALETGWVLAVPGLWDEPLPPTLPPSITCSHHPDPPLPTAPAPISAPRSTPASQTPNSGALTSGSPCATHPTSSPPLRPPSPHPLPQPSAPMAPSPSQLAQQPRVRRQGAASAVAGEGGGREWGAGEEGGGGSRRVALPPPPLTEVSHCSSPHAQRTQHRQLVISGDGEGSPDQPRPLIQPAHATSKARFKGRGKGGGARVFTLPQAGDCVGGWGASGVGRSPGTSACRSRARVSEGAASHSAARTASHHLPQPLPHTLSYDLAPGQCDGAHPSSP